MKLDVGLANIATATAGSAARRRTTTPPVAPVSRVSDDPAALRAGRPGRCAVSAQRPRSAWPIGVGVVEGHERDRRQVGHREEDLPEPAIPIPRVSPLVHRLSFDHRNVSLASSSARHAPAPPAPGPPCGSSHVPAISCEAALSPAGTPSGSPGRSISPGRTKRWSTMTFGRCGDRSDEHAGDELQHQIQIMFITADRAADGLRVAELSAMPEQRAADRCRGANTQQRRSASFAGSVGSARSNSRTADDGHQHDLGEAGTPRPG